MIEVAMRPGGTLEGAEKHPREEHCFLLRSGKATYTAGGDTIRFGPGRGEHQAITGRGIDAKLPGPAVYLTGFAPFTHILEIEA